MVTTHPRNSATQQGTTGTGRPGPGSYLTDWRASLRRAERSCCCPSRPSVVVIIPSSQDRQQPAELFLCRHHYRASEEPLTSASAAVFDVGGMPLTAHTRSLVEAGGA